MVKRIEPQRRRTRTLPPEFVTFLDAVHGDQPEVGVTASAAEFPDLAMPPPLTLTIDEHGWYRASIFDRAGRHETSAYVRREWARDRTLAVLGVGRGAR